MLTKFFALAMCAVVFASSSSCAFAAKPAASGTQHNLVVQISTNDPEGQVIALNNVVNAQKMLGMDNITIEVVAYGPGLKMLTKKSPVAERVKSLTEQNIIFSACGNTMDKIEKETGKKPELTNGVRVVPAGVVRIMELQEQGYSYLRP